MVRPVSSKRKLFNTNKEQFKENEPNQLAISNSPLINLKGSSRSHCIGIYQANQSINKIGLSSEESARELESEKVKILNSSIDEDDGNTRTPGRTVMPMSERQQIALLMQMSSPSNTSELSINNSTTPTTTQYSRGSSKRNERGETLLHVASIKGDADKVSQIISQGANVNAADYAGWTALHEACNRGFTDVASLLISSGADVNAKGLDNETPLHDACINNHYKIVRLLLKSGANTDLLNRRGKSPRDVCRSSYILSLIEQSDAGILEDFDSSEIGNSYCIAGIEKEKLYLPKEFKSSTKFEFSVTTSEAEMSRRTPPNNKLDEKSNNANVNTLAPCQPAIGNNNNSSGGNSSNGNGRPGSPRVTLRLPPVQRTPDKSQQRIHDPKEPTESEDVYEFRCSKDESKGEEREERNDGVKQETPSPDTKCDKRPRENEEEEEETKKKRKKEENRETVKGMGRGTANRPGAAEKCAKAGSRNSSGNIPNKPSSVSNITPVQCSNTSAASSIPSVVSSSSSGAIVSNTGADQRKSPMASAANSPKPATNSPNNSKNSEKGDSDGEEIKNETNSGAPKVPPLKIVLAPCGGSEQETSSQNGKNGNSRQLPYVVNSSSGNSDEKEVPTSECKETSVAVKEEVQDVSISTASPSVSTITSTSTCNNGSGNNTSVNSTSVASSLASSVATTSTIQSMSSVSSSVTSTTNTSEKFGVKIEPKAEEPSSSSVPTEVVHPRKRKLKMKEAEVEPPATTTVPEQSITNCYDMFLKIRKQVERRRKLLFPVQPKPPSGFKDYLMNRCSYVLANNSNSHLSIPINPPPPSLSQAMKDLFNEQEQERHKLKLQQLVEKEKLVLSVEQEILRVHGRAARALANQVLPFSVCTILKDEEVYNIISAEQEEKDRTARSRYNGRLFLSWLQDVDDKWEKIKEAMVLRHHNEAESLHAVQKMDWEWKQKELGLVEASMKAQIDEMHVPMVQVADFDLLPA